MTSQDAYSSCIITQNSNSEAGIATHYVSSDRLPQLLDRLRSLDRPTPEIIDHTIEEFHSERLSTDAPSKASGSRRVAMDSAFSGENVEHILQNLQKLQHDDTHPESKWARTTLEALRLRSPTSLRVAFEALRRGRTATLAEALGTELGIATAFCVGPVLASPRSIR